MQDYEYLFSKRGLFYLGFSFFCFADRKETYMQKVILRCKTRLPQKELEEHRQHFERQLFGEGILVIDNLWDVFVLGEEDSDEEE